MSAATPDKPASVLTGRQFRYEDSMVPSFDLCTETTRYWVSNLGMWTIVE